MQYRSHRYPTQFPIRVLTPHGIQQAHVIDVNQSGARLTGLTRLKRRDKIQLDVLSHKVDAVVLWVARNYVGITFRPLLNDHQLDTLRFRRDQRNAHQRGRVGFGFPGMR